MGRTRKPEDQWMPPRVYRGKSAYEWHPKQGGSVRLCALDSARSVVWKRYEQEISKDTYRGTVLELFDDFNGSADFKQLAPGTQKDYLRCYKKPSAVFGKMGANKVQPKHIRQFMDARGLQSETRANRELSYMSRAFGWGYERGRVDRNPCLKVRKFKEKPRDVYITDIEYNMVYKHARPHVKAAMEISYSCAARISDVLALKRSQLLPEGVYIRQGKTNRASIKAWGVRLRHAIKLANELPGSVSSIYVVHQPNGQKYSKSAFDDAWADAKRKAGEELGYKLRFTFHDVKAKSISDQEGTREEKRQFADHGDARVTDRYDRKTKVVPSLNVQNIPED